MLTEREKVIRRFLILVDAGVVCVAYVLAYLLYDLVGEGRITLTRYALALAFAFPYWCLSLYANGL